MGRLTNQTWSTARANAGKTILARSVGGRFGYAHVCLDDDVSRAAAGERFASDGLNRRAQQPRRALDYGTRLTATALLVICTPVTPSAA